MKATILGGAAASLLTISDLGISPAPPQVVVPPFTWTTCYAGLHAGGGWGQKDLTDSVGILSNPTLVPGGFSSANVDVNGYMLGGQVGCDYQFTPNWIVGIEGSLSGGNIGGTSTFAVPGGDTASFKSTSDFLASVTGRVGYAWDRWMLYGKGGVAMVGDRYHVSDVDQFYAFDGTEDRLGWTAGAGIEWAFTPLWSVKLEYDYYWFGQRSVSLDDSTILGASPLPPFIAPVNITQNIQVVTLGVNFHAPPW
jgi:outer membrane immunogenic protein